MTSVLRFARKQTLGVGGISQSTAIKMRMARTQIVMRDTANVSCASFSSPRIHRPRWRGSTALLGLSLSVAGAAVSVVSSPAFAQVVGGAGANGTNPAGGAGGTTGDGSTIPSTGTTSAGAGGSGVTGVTGNPGTGANPGAGASVIILGGAGGGGAESGGGGGINNGGGTAGGGGGGGARAATDTTASPT